MSFILIYLKLNTKQLIKNFEINVRNRQTKQIYSGRSKFGINRSEILIILVK